MRKTWSCIVSVLVVLAFGCKSETSGEGAGADQTDEKAQQGMPLESEWLAEEGAEPDLDDAIADAVYEHTQFDRERLVPFAERWEGVWVAPVEGTGEPVVWKVTGDELEVYNGMHEYELRFAVEAPCQLNTIEERDGGKNIRAVRFAMAEEKLYAGAGASGLVTDDGFIACTGEGYYVKTEAGCMRFDDFDNAWTSAPGTCAEEDGTVRVELPDSEGTVELERVGGALVDADMKENVAGSYDSFEEARAAVDE